MCSVPFVLPPIQTHQPPRHLQIHLTYQISVDNKFCHECTSKNCVWLLDAGTCYNTCPYNQITCLSGNPRQCPASIACPRHRSCLLCTADGCSWLANSHTCSFNCPPNFPDCKKASDQCPAGSSNNDFQFSGSCSRRCKDVGSARSRLPMPYPPVTFTSVGEATASTAKEEDGGDRSDMERQIIVLVGPLPFSAPLLRPLPPRPLFVPNANMFCSCDVACDDWKDCCFDYEYMCARLPTRN